MKQYCDYECEQCTYETCIRNRPGKPEEFMGGGRICRECGKLASLKTGYYRRICYGRVHIGPVCRECELTRQRDYNTTHKEQLTAYKQRVKINRKQVITNEEARDGFAIPESVR